MLKSDFALEPYLFCSLGVALSVVVPILRRAIPRPEGTTAGAADAVARVWRIARPYIALGAFSLATGLLLVAMIAPAQADWRVALLTGYAWDSTLQKLKV